MFWSCQISISLFLFLLLIHTDTITAIIRYEENVHVYLSGIQFKKEIIYKIQGCRTCQLYFVKSG